MCSIAGERRMTFSIDWSISDDEWELARLTRRVIRPSSPQDAFFHRRVHVLWGPVQFRQGIHLLFPPDDLATIFAATYFYGEPLMFRHPKLHPPPPEIDDSFWSNGLVLSIGELAIRLSFDLIRFAGASVGYVNVLEFWNEDIRIHMRIRKDGVELTSDLLGEPSLVVPHLEFFGEVHRFIMTFHSHVLQHALEILDWRAYEPLVYYVRTRSSLDQSSG